jgi:MFS family permease
VVVFEHRYFTDANSYRCFYINLPIGGLSLLAISFILEAKRPISNHRGTENRSTFQNIRELDLVGTVLSLGSICALLLALQWGGNERPWKSAVVIALICISPIIFALFIAWEYHVGNKAMMPLFLFKRKTQCVHRFSFWNVCYPGPLTSYCHYLKVGRFAHGISHLL